MGWETRGNGRYYYRKRWVNGRAVGEYVGKGYLAEALATMDTVERQERRLAAAEWRDEVDNDRRQSDILTEIEDLVRAATIAVLIANGCYTHRRQWRRNSDRRLKTGRRNIGSTKEES